MKNLCYMTIFVLLALYSCKKQNKIKTLPFDAFYILEYNYIRHYEERYDEFYVAGFCELDKDFSINYARQPFFNSGYYSNSKDIVPDSLRSRISNVLSKYQTDTTFLYQGGPGRIYDGHFYRFIIQKHDQKDITIKFEPQFLPKDLMFVYLYLYENRKNSEPKSTYNRFFEMFRDRVKDDTLPPFPPIGAKVRYIPPVIIDKE